MNNTEKRIKISEIEEIKFQADNIVGLSNIFALFLDFTKENEYLRGSMECLVNEAKRLQADCNNLLEKLFPTKILNKESELDNNSD